MKRGNFYGDGGGGLTAPNSVDISQRRAEGPGDTDWAGIAMKVLRGSPELAGMPGLQDGVLAKRLSDLLEDSQAGFDTTPQEDALLRQAQPEADEYTEQAERMTRDMERNSAFGIPKDPEKRREFVEGLAEKLRGGNGQKPAQPQEPEEKQFSNERFFSDPAELQRVARQVRPRKL